MVWVRWFELMSSKMADSRRFSREVVAFKWPRISRASVFPSCALNLHWLLLYIVSIFDLSLVIGKLYFNKIDEIKLQKYCRDYPTAQKTIYSPSQQINPHPNHHNKDQGHPVPSPCYSPDKTSSCPSPFPYQICLCGHDKHWPDSSAQRFKVLTSTHLPKCR